MKLYNGDCLEIMEQLIEEGVRVDFILTDIPYGVINDLKIDGYKGKENIAWDNIVPIQSMFDKMERILREKGHAVLFSQGELNGKLRTETIHNLPYIYSCFWLKNNHANALMAKKAPVSHIEELTVYFKEYDKYFENPLREYSGKLLEDIMKNQTHGKTTLFRNYKKEGLLKFLSKTQTQFNIPTATNYQFLIDAFNIDTLDYFIPYEELVAMNAKYQKVFNLPEGKKSKSNVLQYDKPKGKEAGLHPTQKPVELLEDLILTYTRPGDIVLDFTMGSGSTGVACKNTGREFIGIELNKDYFNIAKERIECGD